MSTHTTPAGPFGYCGPLNRAERHALAEGQRAAALLAGQDSRPALPAVEARADPATGLAFVLGTVGPATVVGIHPERKITAAAWLDRDTLDAVAAWATGRSKAGFNLYFTPNLPATGLARKPAKTDMAALRALYADVDAKGETSLAMAHAAILALPMPPASFIIATGGGFQPVWLFEAPMPATPELVAQAERDGAAMARLASGDPVQNVDRILRLPFTMNHLNANKRKAGREPCPSGLVLEVAR